MMLARLAELFARLVDAPSPPHCPECRVPMALRREEPVDELPAALERTYGCGRCGRSFTRCALWAIPD
jgi:uncharacterized protein with PIN domain